MFKQIVFTAVAVMMVTQANAQARGAREGKEGGKAQGQVLHETAEKAKETGKETTKNASAKDKSAVDRIVEEYLGNSLDKSVLALARQDKVVARALVDLVKSKKADKVAKTDVNATIDEAQTLALEVLAKIPNLQQRIKDSNLDKGVDKLSETERAVFNLVVQVPSKARKDWKSEEKAIAAEAIKIFAEEMNGKSLDEAFDKMSSRMASHKDEKLRATVDKKRVKEMCI